MEEINLVYYGFELIQEKKNITFLFESYSDSYIYILFIMPILKIQTMEEINLWITKIDEHKCRIL